MNLYLEIGHNRTTRKKGNPKSTLKAESCKTPPIFCNHVAIIASRAQGVYLSEPLPHLVLSPLPVESLDFDGLGPWLCLWRFYGLWAMGCAYIAYGLQWPEFGFEGFARGLKTFSFSWEGGRPVNTPHGPPANKATGL